jgi:hypothetical protein
MKNLRKVYDLVNTCFSELDVKEGRNGQYMQASKITVIMVKK